MGSSFRRSAFLDESTHPGFSRERLRSGESWYLPTALAEERAREREALEEAEEAERGKMTRIPLIANAAQAKQKRTEAPLQRRARKAAKSTPKHGWHRVLPHLDALVRDIEGAISTTRSAESDLNNRRKRLVEKLVTLGPDRKVAMPANWQVATDAIEAALPHFREPIRSVRNALALAAATGRAPRIPPQLLIGPPGLGKTYYSHQMAELFGSTHASVQFDQPSAGAQLRGSDKYWSNSEPGLLFNRICLGEVANPVVLLDEMDKATVSMGRQDLDPLSQLHGALERETSQCLVDISVEIAFDASLTIYIGTANGVQGIRETIRSRMEVFEIGAPDRWESMRIAQSISHSVLVRLGLEDRVAFDNQALCLLAHMSPRYMTRMAEKAVAAAVTEGRTCIGEGALWSELPQGRGHRLH